MYTKTCSDCSNNTIHGCHLYPEVSSAFERELQIHGSTESPAWLVGQTGYVEPVSAFEEKDPDTEVVPDPIWEAWDEYIATLPKMAISRIRVVCPRCHGKGTFGHLGVCFRCNGKGYTIRMTYVRVKSPRPWYLVRESALRRELGEKFASSCGTFDYNDSQFLGYQFD